MRRHAAVGGVVLAATLIAAAVGLRGALAATAGEGAAHWPQWRGPLASGEAPAAEPPVEWDENLNVRWKRPLPGRGHSTPVVWGERVYVTTAVPVGEPLAPRVSGAPGAHDNLGVTSEHEFVVLALDRADGELVWRRSVARALPHEGGHYTASLASASPSTDGRRLFAFFGSYGLYALDLSASDGRVLWQKDLGRMRTKHGHGEGSSPVLAGDTLVVNWDHEGGSFLLALAAATGAERWRVERDEVTSWATPIVVPHDGRRQLIVPGTRRVRGYDLETGEVIWECGGLSANIVASPVAAEGMVFVGSSYEKRALLAIRLEGAQGDITGSDRVVWTRERGTPYVPSPLLYRGILYFLRHYQGILTRVDAASGADWGEPVRLGTMREIYASPVAAAGRVYFTDRSGTTLVLSHEESPRVLAVNRLEDRFNASPALAGGELFLRGEKHLYALGQSEREPRRAD